jgi:hypothetical protein
LEGVGYFIIKVWEPWLEATPTQESNGSFIGGENLRAEFALQLFNEDNVAVFDVQD